MRESVKCRESPSIHRAPSLIRRFAPSSPGGRRVNAGLVLHGVRDMPDEVSDENSPRRGFILALRVPHSNIERAVQAMLRCPCAHHLDCMVVTLGGGRNDQWLHVSFPAMDAFADPTSAMVAPPQHQGGRASGCSCRTAPTRMKSKSRLSRLPDEKRGQSRFRTRPVAYPNATPT